mmetsp:Transcript_3803/g.2524  ORF Transcript_3803/g.2524 Transcript_3803/m.2524 type:complete len:103 (+) Transcript_3803:98-406(+)
MPFECNFCKEIFCGKHRRTQDHRCTVGEGRDNVIVILCPICDTRIKITGDMDENAAWNTHVNSGVCAKELKSKEIRDRQKAAKIKVCQVPSCRTTLTEINRF